MVGDLAAAKSYVRAASRAGARCLTRRQADGPRRRGQHPARLAGQPTQPFRYRDYGNLATIGRNAAVVDLASPVGHFKFSGYFAWLFWLFAHIYFLIGFRNRLVVLIDWASAYWSKQRYARVVTDIEPGA